jgi:hypothetical protein
MKPKKTKQQAGTAIGFESGNDKHSAPTLTEDFKLSDGASLVADEHKLPPHVKKWLRPFPNVDRAKLEAAKSGPEIIEVLRSGGVPDKDIGSFTKSPVPRREGALTLPEAVLKAKSKIENYHNQSGIGWSALAMRRGQTTADKIACAVRFTPRSLLNPGMAAALAGLIEAAHFKTPVLTGVTAVEARKALELLAKGERGSPPSYEPELLAVIVGMIGDTWRPIKEAWALNCRLDEVRSVFQDELEDFTDKELDSLLTDDLLTAAARLAERATGLHWKSYATAWDKCPDCHKHFRLSEKLS